MRSAETPLDPFCRVMVIPSKDGHPPVPPVEGTVLDISGDGYVAVLLVGTTVPRRLLASTLHRPWVSNPCRTCGFACAPVSAHMADAHHSHVAGYRSEIRRSSQHHGGHIRPMQSRWAAR